MKKVLFYAAVAAAGLTACSSENDIIGGTDVTPAENGAVAFEAYSARATRATTNTINNVKVDGFGVYAYDQNTLPYSNYSSSSSYPNFMHNQKVYGVDSSGDPLNDPTDVSSFSKFAYSPLKYYNNNVGAKHSFFAYAPFNADMQAVFDLNKAPQIRYDASQDIDLLWANPTIDMLKPGINHIIQFDFKHALSKVNVYAAPFYDVVHNGTHTAPGTVIDKNTKVIVKSVSFIGNVASQALLNLGDGSWTYEITNSHIYDIEGPVDISSATTANTASSYATLKENMTMIPSIAGGKVKVRVVYDVITTDATHPENSSSRTCTNTSVDGVTIEQGKNMKIYLDLGLTSVKMTARAVDAWTDATPDQIIDVPNNSYWHPIGAYVTTTGSIALATNFKTASTAPASATTGDIYYNTATGILHRYGTSTWENAPVGAYYTTTNGDMYVVTTAGQPCVVNPQIVEASGNFYKSGAWTTVVVASSSAKALNSLNVNSAGQIDLTSGWDAATNGNYYTVTINGINYLVKWDTTNDSY